jgi:hypothetical protein
MTPGIFKIPGVYDKRTNGKMAIFPLIFPWNRTKTG